MAWWVWVPIVSKKGETTESLARINFMTVLCWKHTSMSTCSLVEHAAVPSSPVPRARGRQSRSAPSLAETSVELLRFRKDLSGSKAGSHLA